ncbi:MAG: hypothetical protein LBS21_12405, partial [Clostridiales bacterium]|nr:hypothetical protein [Clostridiales bacterium]
MEGSLLAMKSGMKSKDHFRLISFNAAKWRELSKSDKFKPLLGLLSNGFIKTDAAVEGINLNDPVIGRLNRAIRYSCAT